MRLVCRAITALTLGLTAAADARNVDLSTIPPRDTVQLTIYNTEDLTLVRETRHLTFKPGMNPLQFSWAGTLIDPTSVELRVKTHTDQLELVDTTYPHDKPQMLYWNVRGTLDGEAEVEITYFTSGITWSADYVCVSDPDEETMSFDGFVRVSNNSGEDYADAQIRLVVGTINLVEDVADLARRGVISMDDKSDYCLGIKKAAEFKEEAGRELRLRFAGRLDAAQVVAPKSVVKEGLSEYFIYTIEGTETVKNTWSKRIRSFQGERVPFRIQYRYRPAEYGDQLARLFLLRNDETGELGTTPLPDGIVRLFRDNGHDGLSLLLEQRIEYVPIGQEIVFNLGRDPEVIHEPIRLRSSRDGFWFQRRNLNVYFNPAEGHRIEIDDRLVGWDDHRQWIERIRNYRDKPIDVEIRRSFDGHVVFRSNLDPTLHDYRTVQFTTRVAPGAKAEPAYHLAIHQGHNAKQNNVTLAAED
ncbi:MAG: hypothetical protein GY842_25085 [bacterium]|nr:hypothetical protein [bacterium]